MHASNDNRVHGLTSSVPLALSVLLAACGSGTLEPAAPAPAPVHTTGEEEPADPETAEVNELAVEDDAALRARCTEDLAAPLGDQSIAESLSWLHNRMYTIGETSADLDDWQAAIACVALHVLGRASNPAHADELLAEVTTGATPLVFASANGYPAIVHVLLRFEPVRAHLEDPGTYDLTPWQLSNLAPKLTMLVLNSTLTSDPFRFVPFVVKLPYYGDENLRPYHLVRQLLQEAGAATELEALKTVILDLPGCPDSIKERVRETDDVLSTLRDAVLHDPEHGLPALAQQ